MRSYLRLLLALTIAAQTPAPSYGQENTGTSSGSNIPSYIRSLLIAARSGQSNTGENLEAQLEEEHLQRVKEMERDFLETAPDPETVDSSPIPPREELNQMPIETFVNSDPKYLAGLFSRLLIFGRGKKLKQLITNAIKNLSVSGDSQDYQIRVSGSPVPNASIYPEKALMNINLGLLAMSANEDELAFVIAHEMTHQNKALLSASKDSDEMTKMLDEVNGYSGLDPAQREEIRADLGAVERLIKARYNPWAGYDFMKSMSKTMQGSWDLTIMKFVYRWVFKMDFSYMEVHPSDEIRMAAMKAYILKKSREVDLSDLTQGYLTYKGALKTLHLQMQLISKPLFSRWGQRGQQGLFIYEFSTLFFSESWAAHTLGIVLEPVGNVLGTAIQPVKWTFSKIGDVFSYLWGLVPSLPEQVSQNMPSGSQIAMYALQGIVPLLLATMTICLAAAAIEALVKDEAYAKYKQISADLKELKDLSASPNTSEGDQIVKSLQLLNAIGEGVQTIYDGFSFVRFTRKINGLSVMVLRSYYLYNSVLDQATKYAMTLTAASRDEFVNKVALQFKDMPGYILNSRSVRGKYTNFISLSNKFGLGLTGSP